MRIALTRLVAVLGILAWVVGCAATPPSADAQILSQIGEPRERDTSDMGPYEVAIAVLLDHMTDTALVLGEVQDAETSHWAAGLVDEARPRFVKWRQAMQDTEPNREITYPEMVLNYGRAYLWATLEIENQLKRIKGLDPEAKDPVKDAMLRLKKDLEDAGLPTEP